MNSPEALAPVREALLEAAREEGDRLLREATADAADAVTAAERDVEDATQRARDRGTQAARARMTRRVGRAGADADGGVLGAHEEIRRDLETQVETAALALRQDDRYPLLLDAVESLARSQLGPTADVERDPPDVGGVIATRGNQRVDYTLPAVALRALGAFGDEVGAL